MDNDTGISLGNGKSCYEMIKQTNTIRFYQIEKWTSFYDLYKDVGKLDKFIEIQTKYNNTLNVNTVIRNNGIIIYGYTNNIYNNMIVENAIILIQDIYKLLLNETHSHYNDMYAFSIACDMLNINDVICDIYIDYEIDKNVPKIIINNQPNIIHYYYNKHYYTGYINYVFNNVIDLYSQQKPLELSDDLRKDNKHCLLTDIFTNNQNELIYYDYVMHIYVDNDYKSIQSIGDCWDNRNNKVPCTKWCYIHSTKTYYGCL